MVVIGYSIGGWISRLLITDAGDKLWIALFKKSPDQVPLSPESRKLFTRRTHFPASPGDRACDLHLRALCHAVRNMDSCILSL
jgi:hypothetical protein